jgi:hypothetical protein
MLEISVTPDSYLEKSNRSFISFWGSMTCTTGAPSALGTTYRPRAHRRRVAHEAASTRRHASRRGLPRVHVHEPQRALDALPRLHTPPPTVNTNCTTLMSRHQLHRTVSDNITFW